MQATLEIGVFILGTAGLIWWIYKGLIGENSLGEKLGMAGVKIFFWIIFMFLAFGLISTDQSISVPVLPYVVTYVGTATSFLFVAAGYIASKVQNLRIGKDQRLSGIPTKPNLFSPWIPAVLTGFLSMVLAVGVGMLWFVVISQQQVLQGIEHSLSSGTASASFRMTPDGTAIYWMAGTVVVIVLVTYGFQWLRYRTAWRHYEELRSGIKTRVSAALIEAERNSDTV